MGKIKAETPMMQQHRAIKAKHPDAILLFRVGDFYETFAEDAVIASRVLGIVLTKRSGQNAASPDLAGFPHHSLDTYLHKLVKAGYRVAVCDQLEDPKEAKGVVKRGVTEMITPGVATSDKLLDNGTNNFLAAVHLTGSGGGVAFLDISTGEFLAAEGSLEYLDKLIQSFRPAEIVYARGRQKEFRERFASQASSGFYPYTLDDWIFAEAYATDTLVKHFGVSSLKGFGVENMTTGIIAAGAAIHYLKETEHPNLSHISGLRRIDREDFLWMDKFTIRNLELVPSGGQQATSLLEVLDHTLTPMGARLMKRWIVFPLSDAGAISERLDVVTCLIREQDLHDAVSAQLKQLGDLERIVAKISLGKISPREVVQLARGLDAVDRIRDSCRRSESPYLRQLAENLDPCTDVRDRIAREVVDEPPVQVARGGVIRKGVDPELDELREISSSSKEYLLKMQREEAEATGISSLKIGFNNVFGYYLEVTHTHKDKVPPGWMRKQTLTTSERYITEELKRYEEKITGAEEKILAIELERYASLIDDMQTFIPRIQRDARLLAELDCVTCFAGNARRYQYRRPEVTPEAGIRIREGRHPVIERVLPAGEHYVANDLDLDKDDQQIIILTGPNMSGKSALLRQTALITLMAHMGSYVPAASARIGLTDKIFTRVGASDNLSGGESTFMVEMNETSSILNNLTSRSLVLLDEIGRGTSTYDGISIAWSIVEYLHSGTRERPLTLFATHYHELNELENKLERVRNFHISHQETGNKVVFLRKLTPGGSRHSFGIHVARMAGMPPALVARAEEMLAQLEEKHLAAPGAHRSPKKAPQQVQLTIFDAHTETFSRMRELLEGFDINNLTPVEALLKLSEIKGLLK
jgi:DNA mismatch repair protein MutS